MNKPQLEPNQCRKCRGTNTYLQVWTDDIVPGPQPTLVCHTCEYRERPVQVAFYGSLDFSILSVLDSRGRARDADELLEEVMAICKRNGLVFLVDDVNIAGVDPA